MNVLPSNGETPEGLYAQFTHMRGTFSIEATLEAPQSGVTALFGPSGCGKTTFLRLLCGVDRAKVGKVCVNGMWWQSSSFFLQTWKRPVGVVFQDSRLFPHLTVKNNLEYGAKRSFASKRTNGYRVNYDHTVSWLGLERLLDRFPNGLSGGERQRVALGRAILRNPSLLLLDEPMASLDESSKIEIIPYLEELRSELSIPILYISHDIYEIHRIADRVALMEKGSLLTSGDIKTILTSLELPISRGSHAGAVINADVVEHDKEFNLSILEFEGGKISVARGGMTIGKNVKLRINASDVALALDKPRNTSVLNVFGVKVTGIVEINESQVIVKLDAHGVAMLSKITKKSLDALSIKRGDKCYAMVKSVALIA